MVKADVDGGGGSGCLKVGVGSSVCLVWETGGDALVTDTLIGEIGSGSRDEE